MPRWGMLTHPVSYFPPAPNRITGPRQAGPCFIPGPTTLTRKEMDVGIEVVSVSALHMPLANVIRGFS